MKTLSAVVRTLDRHQPHHRAQPHMQRPFLKAGNLTLIPPLEFKVYDETFKIP